MQRCCIQGKEGIRGKHWFLETDLKSGAALKVDKTGKAILTVLRHLGRLSEVKGPAVKCITFLPYHACVAVHSWCARLAVTELQFVATFC